MVGGNSLHTMTAGVAGTTTVKLELR